MVIVQINQTYNIGSTGKIMHDLDCVIRNSGHDSYMVAGYSNDHSPSNLFCANSGNSYFPIRKDQVIFRITGKNGYRYENRTKKIVDWIDSKKPDVIHLHNIHGDWLHLETLFKYIKKNKVAVVWTLHDCWAFTGRCSHFVSVNCEKWKTKCEKCINKSTYPISYFFDRSKEMYEDKKRLFMNIDNLTIVTPSVWLSKIVKKSFLCQYPIKVIPSGINTEIFLPKKEKSSIYSKIGDKHIILGVANSWTDSKGFNDFIRLDSILDHDRYQIVMVGLNKRQLKQIPKTIVGISKTTNQYQLAELYSGASCYLNCSKLETQGLTTVEALACGTPVVVYNKSAIPEVVGDGCGAVLDTTTPTDVKKVVEYICEESKNKSCMCREHVIEHYRSSDRFDDYLSLYISVGGIS